MSSLVVIPSNSRVVSVYLHIYTSNCSRYLPDGISSPHPNPLGDRAVLFLLNTKSALSFESFVGRLQEKGHQHKLKDIYTSVHLRLPLF